MASLFFTWLEIPFTDSSGQAAKQSLSGWTVFETGDALLLFTAVVVLGLVASRSVEGPWLLLPAGLALSVVASFVFSSVPMTEVYEQVYSSSGFSYDASKGTGVWIAASGSILLAIAGIIQGRAWMSGRPGSRARPPAAKDETRRAEGARRPEEARRAPGTGRDVSSGGSFPARSERPSDRWR